MYGLSTPFTLFSTGATEVTGRHLSSFPTVRRIGHSSGFQLPVPIVRLLGTCASFTPIKLIHPMAFCKVNKFTPKDAAEAMASTTGQTQPNARALPSQKTRDLTRSSNASRDMANVATSSFTRSPTTVTEPSLASDTNPSRPSPAFTA